MFCIFYELLHMALDIVVDTLLLCLFSLMYVQSQMYCFKQHVKQRERLGIAAAKTNVVCWAHLNL